MVDHVWPDGVDGSGLRTVVEGGDPVIGKASVLCAAATMLALRS